MFVLLVSSSLLCILFLQNGPLCRTCCTVSPSLYMFSCVSLFSSPFRSYAVFFIIDCAYRFAFYCHLRFSVKYLAKTTASSSTSCGVALCLVHGFSCTARFSIFRRKISCTKLSDAHPFSEFQNCSKDSACICFRDKKRSRS